MFRRFVRAYCAPRADIPRRVASVAGVVVTGLILGLWCLATYGRLVRTDFLPPPHAVIAAAVRFAADGRLFVDRVTDPTTLATWAQFDRHQRAAYVARAEALVARVGS